jgi:hypothetical protein
LLGLRRGDAPAALDRRRAPVGVARLRNGAFGRGGRVVICGVERVRGEHRFGELQERNGRARWAKWEHVFGTVPLSADGPPGLLQGPSAPARIARGSRRSGAWRLQWILQR